MGVKYILLQYKKIITNRNLLIFYFLIYFLLILLFIKATWILENNKIITQSNLSPSSYLKFPLIINTYAWIASFLSIFWGIFFILFYKSIYQNITAFPKSLKNKIFKTNINFIFTLSFDWILTVILLAFIVGKTYGYANQNIWPYQLIELFIQMLFYLSFSFLIVNLVKNKYQAIALFVGYFFIEAIVRKLLIAANLRIDMFLPMSIATKLVIPPSFDFFDKNQIAYYFNTDFSQTVNIILAICYIFIFLILSKLLIFKKLKTLKS